MRDGRTSKLETARRPEGFREFAEAFDARIVVLTGPASGTMYAIERPRVVIGRGPGVDLTIEDTTLSRQHAAIDFDDGGFRIRDLGSTNGTAVNGVPVESESLDHGDRFQLGGQGFQLVVEERETEPEVYELPPEA